MYQCPPCLPSALRTDGSTYLRVVASIGPLMRRRQLAAVQSLIPLSSIGIMEGDTAIALAPADVLQRSCIVYIPVISGILFFYGGLLHRSANSPSRGSGCWKKAHPIRERVEFSSQQPTTLIFFVPICRPSSNFKKDKVGLICKIALQIIEAKMNNECPCRVSSCMIFVNLSTIYSIHANTSRQETAYSTYARKEEKRQTRPPNANREIITLSIYPTQLAYGSVCQKHEAYKAFCIEFNNRTSPLYGYG